MASLKLDGVRRSRAQDLLISTANRCGLVEASVRLAGTPFYAAISTANRCGLVEAASATHGERARARSPQLIAVASLKPNDLLAGQCVQNPISTANRCGLVEARYPFHAFGDGYRSPQLIAVASLKRQKPFEIQASRRRSPQLIAVASLKLHAPPAPLPPSGPISTANRCGLVEANLTSLPFRVGEDLHS